MLPLINLVNIICFLLFLIYSATLHVKGLEVKLVSHVKGIGVIQILYEGKGNEDLIIPLSELKRNDTFQVLRLECISNTTPLEWIYRGEGVPRVIPHSERRLDLKGLKVEDFVNGTFRQDLIHVASLVFSRPSEKHTGEYICQSQRSGKNETSSLYLYFSGEKPFILEKPSPFGALASGFYFFNQTEIQLFWNTSDELRIPCAISHPNLSISLFRHWGNELTDLSNNSAVRFNQKDGFILKKEINGGDLKGVYSCTSEGSSERIYFSVKQLKENFYLELFADHKEHTYGCSSSSFGISFGRRWCLSRMDCQFLEQRLRNGYLPLLPNQKEIKVVFNADLTEELKPGKPFIIKRHEPLELSSLFFCTAGRNLLSTELIMNHYKLFSESKDIYKLKIRPEHEPGEIERKQTFTYNCFGRAFYFSYGFVWVLEFENGTQVLRYGEMREKYSGFLRSKLTIHLNENDTNLSSVQCFAPFWDSNEWQSTLFIEGQEEEEVEFSNGGFKRRNEYLMQGVILLINSLLYIFKEID